MPHPVTCAAILAGGKSSRMGREKALIDFEGQALISRVAQVLQPIFPRICVITSNVEVGKAAGCAAVPDQFPDCGPLGGIHAALTHFQEPTFIVACDMPFLNGDLVTFLAANFRGDALVPEGENGPEPLHAVYDTICTDFFASHLTSNQKIPSLRRVLSQLDTHFVNLEKVREFDASLRCFSNWNTPEDMEGAQTGA